MPNHAAASDRPLGRSAPGRVDRSRAAAQPPPVAPAQQPGSVVRNLSQANERLEMMARLLRAMAASYQYVRQFIPQEA